MDFSSSKESLLLWGLCFVDMDKIMKKIQNKIKTHFFHTLMELFSGSAVILGKFLAILHNYWIRTYQIAGTLMLVSKTLWDTVVRKWVPNWPTVGQFLVTLSLMSSLQISDMLNGLLCWWKCLILTSYT